MDAFMLTAMLILAMLGGAGIGSVLTYDAAKHNKFANEGITYSYFNNVRFRSNLGR